MSKTYPRWGGLIRKLPPATGKVCWHCTKQATRVAEIRLSYMRGDEHPEYELCGDNKCRDALKDYWKLEGEARHT